MSSFFDPPDPPEPDSYWCRGCRRLVPVPDEMAGMAQADVEGWLDEWIDGYCPACQVALEQKSDERREERDG